MTALIAAEWRKARTQRSTWLIFAVGLVLIVAGVSGLLARPHPEMPDLAGRAVGHLGLMSILSLLLGVLSVAGEFRHRTIAETFAAAPRRHRVLTAKIVVIATTALGFAVVGAGVALGVAALWLRGKGGVPVDATLWRTIGGAIGWNVAYAVIGVGVGAAVRNLTGAVAATISWIALVEGLVGQLVGDSASRWLPFRAGMALGRMSEGAALSQSGAAVTVVVYAAALAVAGYLVTAHRDIEA